MAQNAKKQTASLATIVSLIMIISTVIVFTVLLFLSYEKLSASTKKENKENVHKYSELFAAEIDAVIDDDRDFEKDVHKMKLLQDSVNSIMNFSKGSIYIIDEDYSVIYSKEKDELNYEFNFRDLAENPGNVVRREYDSSNYIIYDSAPIGDTGLTAVYASVFDVAQSFDQFKNIIVFPALIAIIIALVLFLLVVRLSYTPLREMSRVMIKVSEGDLSERVDDKYCSTEEIKTLSASSDLVMMADTLNDMITKLENQEKDRQIFISSVAHDIRTPLTSINGFVTAMMDGTIPPENYDKYMGLIKKEVNRIRELVVSMTEASSLAHVDPDDMEKFPLDDVINDIVSNLEPQLGEKNIECEVRLSQDPKAKWCYGEAQQLCRVVQNIITNAIKFTPESGRILVTTEPDKSEKKVYIAVEDSGIGIPKEKRSRVFESFYKVDSSRTKEGFGLGLFICKQILQGHGQGIRVDEGEELGGARFVFSFPMAPEDA